MRMRWNGFAKADSGVAAIEFAVGFAGADHVLAGSDYPHAIGSIPQMLASITAASLSDDVKQKIFAVVKQLDVRAPQVMLHVVIGQLSLKESEQFGKLCSISLPRPPPNALSAEILSLAPAPSPW